LPAALAHAEELVASACGSVLGDLRGKAFVRGDAIHDSAMKAGAMLGRKPERVGGLVEDGVPVDESVERFQVALLDAGLHRARELDAFILGKRDGGAFGCGRGSRSYRRLAADLVQYEERGRQCQPSRIRRYFPDSGC
jgi:hypothetical protein